MIQYFLDQFNIFIYSVLILNWNFFYKIIFSFYLKQKHILVFEVVYKFIQHNYK